MAGETVTIDRLGEQQNFGVDPNLPTNTGGNGSFIPNLPPVAEDPFPERFGPYNNIVFIWGENPNTVPTMREEIERRRALARGLTSTALSGYTSPIKAFQPSASGHNQFDPAFLSHTVETSLN